MKSLLWSIGLIVLVWGIELAAVWLKRLGSRRKAFQNAQEEPQAPRGSRYRLAHPRRRQTADSVTVAPVIPAAPEARCAREPVETVQEEHPFRSEFLRENAAAGMVFSEILPRESRKSWRSREQ